MKNLRKNKKLSLLIGIVLLTFLFSCSRKNPLLEDKYVERIQENAMFVSDSKSFYQCLAFYRDKIKDNDLKEKCDKWIVEYHRELIRFGNIPASTKVDDLKSTELWERVRSAKLDKE